MRQVFKPVLMLTAAVNLILLVLVVGRGGAGSTVASELFPISSTYSLSDLFLTQRVGTLVQHQYVDPERIDPDRMFDRALEQVQRGVPEVLFEYHADTHKVSVRVDDFSDDVEVSPMAEVSDVVEGLRAVLTVVGEHWQGDPADLPDVEYSAINGMLSTLDPHSILLPPDNAKQMDVQIQGQFGGLGISISLRGEEQTLTVVNVLPETPAMRTGLKAGDQILQIDGESTVNIDLNEAVDKLRGPVGSRVEILVARKTFDEPQPFKIRRDLIRINSVETSYLGDGYGLIKIKTFQHNTYQQLLAGLAELKAQGPIKGLLLDLRNNPGGPLQQAVDVADRFIDTGDLVSTVQSYSREKDVKRAHRSGTEEPYPMVVILDSNAASASEIVAGALKNHDRAVVIGETSFGKGSVQNLFQNPDDSKLKLTMLQYLTPGDQSIQSVGITPDVRLTPVYFDDELVYLYSTAHIFRERDLEEHLDSDPRDFVEQDPPMATVRYFAPEQFRLPGKEAEEGDADAAAEPEITEEPAKPDPLDDYQVRFGRDLLKEAGRATRRATLNQAKELIAERAGAAEAELVEQMKAHGVDWAAGPAGSGPVKIDVAFGAGGEPLVAGNEIQIKVTATNNGVEPVFRGRAITRSELGLFNQIEFVFGRIEPGESRSWTREMKLSDSLMDLAEPVTVDFIQGDGAPVTSEEVLVQVRELPRPAFAYTLVPIDDGSGNSRGNGDGRIQRGEAIDLLVVAANVGDGPTSRAFFKLSNEEGRHVYLKSGTANFGEIPAGGYAVQRLSFEVRETLPGDSIAFEVRSGDAHMLAQPRVEVSVPVASGQAPTVKPASKVVKVPAGEPLRISADEDAQGVAVLDKEAALAVDGELDGWLRVRIPMGGDVVPGWIRAKAAGAAKGPAATSVELTPELARSAPRIAVRPSAIDVPDTLTSLQVTGSVRDDQAVRKVYAFVNGKKRFFWSISDAEQTRGAKGVDIPLSFELPLEEGTNLVEVYAHDNEDMRATALFQVYRDPHLTAAVKE